MNSNDFNVKPWLIIGLVTIASLGGLNLWQYYNGVLLEREHAAFRAQSEQELDRLSSDWNGLDDSLATTSLQNSKRIGPGSHQAEQGRRRPVVAERDAQEVDEEIAEHEVARELARVQAELDESRQRQFESEFLRSESPTLQSEYASTLLRERFYSEPAISTVNLEVRLSLRGVQATDDELLWMGDCAELGAWPFVNQYGEPDVQLSITQKFGAERLASSLDMISLANLISESTAEDVPKVWGKHLETAFLRMPPMERAILKTRFPGALAHLDG